MAETQNAATENRLPSHYAKLGSDNDIYADTGPPDEKAVRNPRRKIERCLCAPFQCIPPSFSCGIAESLS